MSDEQTIYISPDDDLTTVRERLERVPARKITLVIPSQTQLRSQTAWKVLYADARKLSKEVVIVSSDPQVRSVAHAGKFRVAHSLESISNSGSSRSGSSPGTGRSSSGTGRGRSTGPSSAVKTHTTPAKEPTSRRGASRAPRGTRPPLTGQAPGWPELNSFVLPETPDTRSSQFDEPHTAKPQELGPSRLTLPERNERREERSGHQIYDFRPEALPPIHPLPIDQIEESDLLPYTPIDREDYEKARDIRQAATGSHPVLQQPEDVGSATASSDDVDISMPEMEASPAPTNQPPQPLSPVYGEDDPFIYMQDDSQLPSHPEQKAEAILQDDENSQEYPSLQKPAISDLPTHVIENEIEVRGDNDDDVILFPISSTSSAQARTQDEHDEEDKTVEHDLFPRAHDVPAWSDRSDILSPPRQPFDEEEDQLPAFPEHAAPMRVPEPLPLPMPRAQSKPLPSPAKPLPPRLAGQMQQQVPAREQAPTQKPGADSTTRNGSRVSPSQRSRPAPQPVQPRGVPARPRSAVNTSTRRPATRRRSRRPAGLYLVLVSIAAIVVVLFAVLYFNTASTVQITVATQDYAHPVTFTLSNQNQPGTVPATLMTQTFTKTGPEPATGSIIGNVNFVNTGTVAVVIPSQTVVATRTNVKFITKAEAFILPQNANPAPVPVPIQVAGQAQVGNLPTGSITVIPADSLQNIAQAQSPPVNVDSLKTTLSVTNPEAITGGNTNQAVTVTQQDLDNAKTDLHKQLQADINKWIQQNSTNGLVGSLVTNDVLINPPAIDTPEPDKTFSASISITATILVAQLVDAQKVAVSQLNNAVQADRGPNFAIIGDWQAIKIDLTQQKAGDGNTVTVPVTGKVGPYLNIADLQNSIKGKSRSDAQTLLRRKDPQIQQVDIQTQPGIFWWVSPWADHITVIIRSAT